MFFLIADINISQIKEVESKDSDPRHNPVRNFEIRSPTLVVMPGGLEMF